MSFEQHNPDNSYASNFGAAPHEPATRSTHPNPTPSTTVGPQMTSYDGSGANPGTSAADRHVGFTETPTTAGLNTTSSTATSPATHNKTATGTQTKIAPDIHHLPGPAPHTAGPHHSDILNVLDPRVDSDMSNRHTIDAYARAHPGSLPGPAPHTAGPHKSDLLNKLDPRIHHQGYAPAAPPSHIQSAQTEQVGVRPLHDGAGTGLHGNETAHAGPAPAAGVGTGTHGRGHQGHAAPVQSSAQAPQHPNHDAGPGLGASVGAALRPHESELDRVRAGYPGTHVPIPENAHDTYGDGHGVPTEQAYPQGGHQYGGTGNTDTMPPPPLPERHHEHGQREEPNPNVYPGVNIGRSNLGGSGLAGSRAAAGPAVSGGGYVPEQGQGVGPQGREFKLGTGVPPGVGSGVESQHARGQYI